MNEAISFEHISTLHMFILSAELHFLGSPPRKEIEISCELSNIARGSCVLVIHPANISARRQLGQINIPLNRPVMRGDITVSDDIFEQICAQIRHVTNRPASIIISLTEKIAVSDHGDLWITETTDLIVSDISWIWPLL